MAQKGNKIVATTKSNADVTLKLDDEPTDTTFEAIMGDTAQDASMVPVNRQDALTSEAAPFSGGDSEFEEGDLRLSYLRLAQGLTPEVKEGLAEPGQFVLEGFEPQETVTFIPTGFRRTRRYADMDTLICASQDARVGTGEYGPGSKENPSGACASCPMSQWTEGRGGKRVPPPCKLGYRYQGYSLTHDAPTAIIFSKTGEKTGKLLNTLYAAKGPGNFAVRIGKATMSSGVGANARTWFVPTVTLVKVDDEQLEMARALAPAIAAAPIGSNNGDTE